MQGENKKTRDGRNDQMHKRETGTQAFDKAVTDIHGDKSGLRDQIAELEDALRKITNQLEEVKLDNENLDTQLSTEAKLKEEKADAETKACRSVNNDIRAQIQRLEDDVHDEKLLKDCAQRSQKDIEDKHKVAQKNFEKVLKAAETEKKNIEKELSDLKGNLQSQKNDNIQVSKSNDDHSREIQRLEY